MEKITEVLLITKKHAVPLILQWHYSKVLPRINKHFIGGFVNNELVAVCTLGYGVRPLHTIKKIFPTLISKDYFEIGKLCLAEWMPKNSESNFISQCIKLIKREMPEIKLLYSWSDGILGKPGYVYQASNFFYGGYITTEMYLDENGMKLHPRTVQGISTGKKAEGAKFNSRAFEVTQKMGLIKYFGKQFRYLFPLCSRNEWKKLQKTSPETWTRSGYPKDADCIWEKQIAKGIREKCDMPPYLYGDYAKKVSGGLMDITKFISPSLT